MPVLGDGDLVLAESAAILVYLAEKTASCFRHRDRAERACSSNCSYHASGLSPVFGNVGFFRNFAPEPIPGEFITTELGEAAATAALATQLAARPEIVGIVNNVGLARHKVFGAVDPLQFAAVLDLNLRPALQ